jgi:hypothetical protein
MHIYGRGGGGGGVKGRKEGRDGERMETFLERQGDFVVGVPRSYVVVVALPKNVALVFGNGIQPAQINLGGKHGGGSGAQRPEIQRTEI